MHKCWYYSISLDFFMLSFSTDCILCACGLNKIQIYKYGCAHKMCNDCSSTDTSPQKTKRFNGLWNHLFKSSDWTKYTKHHQYMSNKLDLDQFPLKPTSAQLHMDESICESLLTFPHKVFSFSAQWNTIRMPYREVLQLCYQNQAAFELKIQPVVFLLKNLNFLLK